MHYFRNSKKDRLLAINISKDTPTYTKEIQTITTSSLEEVATIIEDAKASLKFKYVVSENCSPDVSLAVENSQKYTVESLDSIYTIVSEQALAIEKLVTTTTDLELVKEKITVIEENSRRKVQIALETTAETAISAGFEGKSVTWVETAQIPASFKNVKVFAFDLADTVVNYRETITKAWSKLISKKQDSYAFIHINIEAFITRWYYLYLEERLKAKYSVSDADVLLIALKLVFIEFKLELSAFTEEELINLCSAWFSLELFEDASASIRKIKQLDGVYAVAISHAFTIRTMMDLARTGCLCWHAQFTADMFAACTINNGTSTEVTVVSNTAMLLGLNNASELAVVSSNPKILEAAQANGSKAVALDRFGTLKQQGYSFDVEFDALDIFAESFHMFYETQVYKTVEVPVTRSWFQRVVSTVTEVAESVGHTILG
ncbi:uncharacterized protein B0P05DRAFT_574918 [Gilbertella persicaria]|uniref:uncharacterized protein n=1 Tax=Gilbertella persicaria TaxID=101096 RepID=UPI00221FF609|nr:uncharacterized protein B0P05DRAFT_574918 [Gilbertella persicaria]KAI8059432.1 hypothetical protein B0P05DRAFT_574918 [Gilbertella persicaria]